MENEIIDYELSENIDTLKKLNIIPYKESELFITAYTSNIEQDKKPINGLFSKPIKFTQIDQTSLDKLYDSFEIKKDLYIYGKKIIENQKVSNDNSYILNFLDVLLKSALNKNSSDIHIESFENYMLIRFRIDGVLVSFFKFYKELFPYISSIVKFLASLDISQKRLPLDGRFTREIGSKNYEFRLSTLPSIYSESIVIRILDNNNILKDINNIGFDKENLEILKGVLKLNQGLVLVTGPTGSGKTTTLYSAINYINDNTKKIITIEEPVEYKLENIIQVGVNKDIGLDYQDILKNILRQDPDIILIGEIRDSFSLSIALRAALTGHLVIASIHTNGALETIDRLIDLEAQPFLIASTLKAVISQRLVRKLCDKCKVYDEVNGTYLEKGCSYCSFTGFKDRQVISECLDLYSTKLSKLISVDFSIERFSQEAKFNGFKNLRKNSQIYLDKGITSLNEVLSKIPNEI